MRKTQSSFTSRLAIAGISTGALVAAVLVAPGAAFAATVAAPAIGPNSGTITVTDSGAAFPTTVAAVFRADSCVSTYVAPTTAIIAAANVVRVDASTATLTVPAGATLAANGIAKTYNICFYTGAVAGSSTLVATNTVPTYTVQATSTVNPTSGASGGGNTITVTAPTASAYFTGVTAPGAYFTTGACNTTYLAAAGTVGTVTKAAGSNTVATVVVPAGVLGTGATAAPYNICFYNGTTVGTSTYLSSATYNVTLPALTLSAIIGPSTGGNGITATSTTNFLTGVTTPGAAFTTAATCPTTYPAASSYVANTTPGVIQALSSGVSTARKLADNRLAVTVPALPLTASAPTLYQACFYNGSTAGTSTIVAGAAYTSTTVPTPTGITPNAGPALGGSTITITGTNFPTTAGSISATLGGTALTNVTPVSSTAFTAVTPAHVVASDVALVVTTGAGSRVLQAAYSFTNALSVTPNTAPNTIPSIDVDVRGTGFLTETFGVGNARIYLVNGVYNGTNIGSSTYANGAVADCTNVLVISDDELICSLQLNRRLDATGAFFDPVTYANTIVTTGSGGLLTTSGSKLISLEGANAFRPNDVGALIVAVGIPAGATITAVLSPTQATISANATATVATGNGIGAAIGAAAVRTLTTLVSFASGATTVTAPAGTFLTSDVGRVITATGIPAGTTITAVAAGGASATISNATTTLGATATALLYASAAVPNGAYNLTMVSNGDLDGATTDPDYTQSAVSSSSTFTVAPF